MTGLKQIENQRAFEKEIAHLKQTPAYKLLKYTHEFGGLTGELKETVRVFLDTGVLPSRV